VVAWLRALPRNASASEPPPKRPRVQQALSFVGPNAVDVVQSVRQTNEPLGTGNGQPGQQLRLAFAPVLARSLTLTVFETACR